MGVENCYLLIYYKSDNDSFSGVRVAEVCLILFNTFVMLDMCATS